MQRSEFALIHLPYTHPKIARRADLPRRHALGRRRQNIALPSAASVALAEVVEEPLILFHADSISRKVVDEKLAEAGLVN